MIDKSLFKIRSDEDGSLNSIMIVIESMRKKYEFFGDLMIIDTTHDTNKFKFKFLNIVGINNHGKNITFGHALIVYE